MWRTSETKDALMEAWAPGNEMIVFDTETTGFSAQKCNIIQISAIKIRINDDLSVEKIATFDEYINPGYSVPPKIVELTGITDEFLEDKPSESEVFKEKIYPFFGDSPIVSGYNSDFDIRFLSVLYERNGKVFSPSVKLDVLKMARDLVGQKETKDKKLGTVAALYGADKGLTFHNSLDDVIATGRLMFIFYKEYKEKEKEKSTAIKKTPEVKSIFYWEKFQNRRIYINTNLGGFYYDIRNKVWDKKRDNPEDIDSIDMEALRLSTFKAAKVSCEEELARYRN